METLQIKIVKTQAQYFEYCNKLEALMLQESKTPEQEDLVELLTLLIEKWDDERSKKSEEDPVIVLRFLMEENNLKSVDLAKELEISAALVSDILHYRRGLSKLVVRKLAERFKVNQALFNREYRSGKQKTSEKYTKSLELLVQ